MAILEAMLAHDRSIRTLWWTQRVTFERFPGDWQVLQESRQAIDERGQWWTTRRTWTWENGAVEPESRETSFSIDDHEVARAHGKGRDRGLIRPLEHERVSTPSPLMALGRWMDQTGLRRLGEMMLEAPDLCVLPQEAPGLVTVQGTVVIGRIWRVLEVTVDPQHGFMPQMFRQYEDLWGMLAEEFAVTEAREINGIWVPTKGWRILYGSSGHLFDDDAIRVAFEGELDRIGFGGSNQDLNDPQVRAAYRQAIRTVYGDTPLPVVRAGSGEGVYCFEATDVHVNGAIPAEMSTVVFPYGCGVFSTFVGVPVVRGEAPPDVGGNASDERYWRP